MVSITEIKTKKISGSGRGHVGFVSFVLDNVLKINGVGVYEKLDGSGLRLLYPRQGETQSVYPITRSVAGDIVDAVEAQW
jgi:DNA-binding cell septation regulator SpoVG